MMFGRMWSACIVMGVGLGSGVGCAGGSVTEGSVMAGPPLEVVAELEAAPGNLAVTPSGRIMMSLHPFGAPEYSVVELHADGRTTPYPSELWSAKPADGSAVGLNTVIGIESDRQGVLWMLDLGSATQPPKLVAWDTTTETLDRVIWIPAPVHEANSFMQDLAIDPVHDAVYIADMSRGDLVGESSPAIVVVDLTTGLSRRLLDGHRILQPEAGSDFVIEGKQVQIGEPDGPTPSLGLNPITIDAGCEYVYFGAMNGRSLYRLATTDLLDASLSDVELAARAERFGGKAPSDGISIDASGNVYVTDVNGNAIGVTTPDGAYRTYIEDDRLIWADGISFGPEGWGYATVNQLHRFALLNGGVSANRAPYHIVRFRPLGRAIPGR